MTRPGLLVAALLGWTLFMWVAVARTEEARYQRVAGTGVLLPDPDITPGAVVLFADPLAAVCASAGRYSQTPRHVTEAMKRAAYARYGARPKPGVCCEVDHLIPRELLGADVAENLWPQPYTPMPGAHQKDWLEHELHRRVCAGALPLRAAQECIARDWYACWVKTNAAEE
jgi:hypothetical protein